MVRHIHLFLSYNRSSPFFSLPPPLSVASKPHHHYLEQDQDQEQVPADGDREGERRKEFASQVERLELGLTIFGIRPSYQSTFNILYVVTGIMVFMIVQTPTFKSFINS
eukprot:TRINITY_DN18336_c0_g1_i1.p1 TRINITY_DN18336_c0_g1~~TRINITY_DN18336_c0_g1_i1.p1  ORF type:complete len:109 (-),score=26.75 TRINITY_DN18336_c0_g1_i1:24-350(-)